MEFGRPDARAIYFVGVAFLALVLTFCLSVRAYFLPPRRLPYAQELRGPIILAFAVCNLIKV